MYKIDPVPLLKESGLSVTEPRKRILMAFLQKKTILTQKDVRQLCYYQYDRVTVYRTLERFVQTQIIHIIPSTDNVARYALLNHTLKTGCLQYHLHFMCKECGQTYCLENAPVPLIVLPQGFLESEVEVVIKGICKKCN
ncbi:MAG: transcriptional repressor [Chitinophagaceae bacterium]|nr:transcriptional repressor [Chitinophagaceae bacterium]